MATPPAVGKTIAAAATSGARHLAGTSEVLGHVRSMLAGEAAEILPRANSKLSWDAQLPELLGQARDRLKADGHQSITRDMLVDRATHLVETRLAAVNTKGADKVSADEVRRLSASDPVAGSYVAGAYSRSTGRTIDVGATGTAKETTASGVTRDELTREAAAKTAGNGAADVKSAANAKKAGNGLGFSETDGTGWPSGVQAVVDNLRPSVGGRQMGNLIDALGRNGTSVESVADQLISGKGNVADLFIGRGAKHELTDDAVNTLVERLSKRPPPDSANKRQVQEYVDRLEGLSRFAMDGRRTAVDPGDETPPAYLRGRNGDARIDPRVYRDARAAMGPDGYLAEQRHQGLSGILRQAADFLRMIGGPALMISAPMLSMAASQIMAGLPMVMGMPYAGYTNPTAYSSPSLFQSVAMPFMMQAAQTLPAMAMNLFGGGNYYAGGNFFGGQPPAWGAGTFTPWAMSLNPSNFWGSNEMTTNSTVMRAGFMPTGNGMFDLSNAIANAPTYSPTEQALLSKIKDPEQRAIQELQMQMQKQALLCTVLTNLANMRHEMLKAVAQNLRS